MSYARFSYADVYVYLSCYGHLDCCGCSLSQADPKVPDRFETTAEMLAHLDAHRAAGHDVPDETYEGLREDAAENDEWMTNVADGMCAACDGTGECRDYAPHDVKAPCVFCGGSKRCSQCNGRGGTPEWSDRALRSGGTET